MKKLTFIYLKGCPYCKKAMKAFDALLNANDEYKKVEITLEMINCLRHHPGIPMR